MKNILGIIPARGGSKGLKNKNLLDLCGKPLIWHTINTAMQSEYINRLVVSTEDKAIADYVELLNVAVVPRPPELATDESIVVDALIHAADYLKDENGFCADAVINLNPTSPLRSLKYIDKALKKLIDSDCDSVFSAVIAFNLAAFKYGAWEVSEEGQLKSLYDHFAPMRRQDFSHKLNLRENGAIYAITTEALLKYKSLIGAKPEYIAMPYEESIDINTEQDLYRAEVTCNLLLNN